MLRFIDHEDKEVLAINSQNEKTISLCLPFSLDTMRFMQSVTDAKMQAMKAMKGKMDLIKYKDVKDEDVTNLTDTDLEKIVGVSDLAVSMTNTKGNLMMDLQKLLGLENENVTFGEMAKLYKLVLANPANQFPED